MGNFIPLSVPNIKGNELEYVKKALESEWVSTAGSYIKEFEDKVAEYVNVTHAVACQSGTAGLHLALLACGVKQNDEVIVPTLTFVAAVNPIKYIGAEPIFMDCDDTLTMDTYKFRRFCIEECNFINEKLINKKTGNVIRAVVIVHVFGNIANMKEIKEIANAYNLRIIEDATEALGSYYTQGIFKGYFAGTIGDIGVYSFNGNKIITTGGGGMIVSKIKEFADRCRHLSTQAKSDTLYFDHDDIGYNYRMTNLQAALGLAQLEQLEKFIEIKMENYMEYRRMGLQLLPFSNDIRPNYWFYSYVTDRRDELIQYLHEKKIQARPIWRLIHTLKPYEDSYAYKIDKAIFMHKSIINIPCSSNLTREEVHYVASEIIKCK